MPRPLVAALLLASSLGAGPWHQDLDFSATEARLASAPVLRMGSFQDFLRETRGVEWHGSNPLQVATLAGGTHAVFRSEDEPWGSIAEVAGYRMARRLGLRLVPPTVPRTLALDGAPRPGSLQLVVEAGPGVEAPLPEKERADVEVLAFLMGAFDNHSGNLLRDATGAPVMIDFENALDVQYQRYGDFPFVKRGGQHHPEGIEQPGWGAPFPFEAPRKLVDPSLEHLKATFSPWWGQYWAGGMDALHRMLEHIPERTVPYVIYRDQLWVQVRVASRHPAHTEVYSAATIEALRSLARAELTRGPEPILPEPFDERHVRALWDRRRQLLAASQRGLWIR